jgi:hypothetical protein
VLDQAEFVGKLCIRNAARPIITDCRSRSFSLLNSCFLMIKMPCRFVHARLASRTSCPAVRSRPSARAFRDTHCFSPIHIAVLIFFGRDMVRSLPWSAGFQRLAPSAIMQLYIQMADDESCFRPTCNHTPNNRRALKRGLLQSGGRSVALGTQRKFFINMMLLWKDSILE